MKPPSLWGAILAVAVAGGLHVSAAMAADSAYTSLTECKTTVIPGEAGEQPTGTIATCPGRDGFSVLLTSGDDRSWLVFKHPTGGTSDLMDDVFRLTPGQFPMIRGKVLEWRFAKPGAPARALIFRVGGSDPATPNGPEKQALLVARIAAGNVQVVTAVRTNEEARRVADGLVNK